MPKDTIIRIHLECPECPNTNYTSVTDVTVKNDGMFDYKFSNEDGDTFDSGKYIAYVETAPEIHQPDLVKKVFGKDGGNLAGSNVLGDSETDRVAFAEINFKIKNTSKVKKQK